MNRITDLKESKKQQREATETGRWPKVTVAVAVLLIFYAVGFYGLGFSAYRPLFQALVPFNLLLTNAILFFFHKGFSRSFWVFAGVVAGGGFLAEVLGVHTGLLFGAYQYGPTLGLQLWQVPLLIGLNWLMLVYTTGHLTDLLRLPWPIKALLAAVLMVGLDYFIEPVAVTFDFWAWQGGQIPFSNYAGWFGLSLLLQVYYQQAGFRKGNPVAPFVFLVQVLFFAGLYLRLS
ncbi:hypothetical protein BH24BAC1_BH24BAC1_11340 [soil metagenome]|jgi:putative membrane protein